MANRSFRNQTPWALDSTDLPSLKKHCASPEFQKLLHDADCLVRRLAGQKFSPYCTFHDTSTHAELNCSSFLRQCRTKPKERRLADGS